MSNDSKVPLQHECSFNLAALSVFRPINRQRCCPPSSHVVGQAKYNEAEERYQQALEICRATRDGAQLQVSVSNNLAELRLIQVRTKYSTSVDCSRICECPLPLESVRGRTWKRLVR